MSTARNLRTGEPVREPEPGSRTSAGTAAWMRRAEERAAERLRSRGWIVLPPETELRPGGLVDVPLPLEEQ